MKFYDYNQIVNLKIDNKTILQWVKEAFLLKEKSILPKKISMSFNENKNFYNVMPCIIPSININGVKIVSRYLNRNPSIKGELILYDYSNGNLLGIMDATWITAKRTGAVAALAVETFAKKNFSTIAVIGLGQTGQSFLDMFLTNEINKTKVIKLMKYKDHAEKTAVKLRAKGIKNIIICNNYEELIKDSDVIVSAVTFANTQFGKDEWYKEGVLVVPIHTRGFQNCDLFFDKVFADDTSHVRNFKYFDKFKYFAEFSEVLKGKIVGRKNNKERILSYNIGIAIHDVYIGKKILDIFTSKGD
jgi:alanine dehydrogenase